MLKVDCRRSTPKGYKVSKGVGRRCRVWKSCSLNVALSRSSGSLGSVPITYAFGAMPIDVFDNMGYPSI